jgi:hypothetical protein
MSEIRCDRTEPCVECPYRPGGILGQIKPETLARIESQFPCHMSFGAFDEHGAFRYFPRPKYQRCAGHVIFMANTGRPQPWWWKDGRMLKRLTDPGVFKLTDPGVFKTVEELIAHHTKP